MGFVGPPSSSCVSEAKECTPLPSADNLGDEFFFTKDAEEFCVPRPADEICLAKPAEEFCWETDTEASLPTGSDVFCFSTRECRSTPASSLPDAASLPLTRVSSGIELQAAPVVHPSPGTASAEAASRRRRPLFCVGVSALLCEFCGEGVLCDWAARENCDGRLSGRSGGEELDFFAKRRESLGVNENFPDCQVFEELEDCFESPSSTALEIGMLASFDSEGERVDSSGG